MDNDDLTTWEKLRRQVIEASTAYYNTDSPTLSDFEFDILKRRAIEVGCSLFGEVRTLQELGVGAKAVSSDVVKHATPMLSLSNVFNEFELKQWWDKLNNPALWCEMKYDGLALALVYNQGVLESAAKRGDGLEGDSVLHMARAIKGIPMSIEPKHRIEVRGEVVMPRSALEKLQAKAAAEGTKPLANPRNAAAGALAQRTPTAALERELQFIPYQLIEDPCPATQHETIKRLMSLGFKMPAEAMAKIESNGNLIDVIVYAMRWRDVLEIDTDGIVFKVDDREQAATLDKTAISYPRSAVAYKFPPMEMATKLLGCHFQVGATGLITPVATFAGVMLGGTMVNRATLHNEDRLKLLNLHIGDKIIVRKSGEIIPEIVNAFRTDESHPHPIQMPKHCVCGAPLARAEGYINTYCTGGDKCGEQAKYSIVRAFSDDAWRVNGIGSITAMRLAELGISADELFAWSVDDWVNVLNVPKGARVDGWVRALKEAANACTPGRFLNGFNIPLLGLRRCNALAERFLTLSSLFAATVEELENVDMGNGHSFGPVCAKAAYDFFRVPSNQERILLMLTHGFKYDRESDGDTVKKLTIAYSGTFPVARRIIDDKILSAGHRKGSVSRNTDVFVCGVGAQAGKVAKARALGIEIVDFGWLAETLGIHPEEPDGRNI